MALNQVGYISSGCSQLCKQSCIAKSKNMAFCANRMIYLYDIDVQTNADSRRSSVIGNTALAQQPPANAPPTVTEFHLSRTYGSDATNPITAFDYNDEYMFCLMGPQKSIRLWHMGSGECLNEKKIPSSLLDLFNTEGSLTTACVAGKHHLLFGTTLGRIISINLQEGNTPRTVKLSTMSGQGLSQSVTAKPSETVECIAVSPVRHSSVIAGTSDGVLFILSLNPSSGLQQTGQVCPFPAASSKEKDKEKSILLGNSFMPVTSAAFDLVNPNTAVVGSQDGGLALIDVSSFTVTQLFDLKSIDSVTSISWMPNQQGFFATVDGSTNRVYVWSISSKTPVNTFCPIEKNIPIKSLSFLSADRLMLTDGSGTTCVYNLQSKTREFRSDPGHSDLLTGCRFARHNPDLVASCAYDGAIKVWNTRQMKLQSTIEIKSPVVHALDWSPTGKYIVVSLGNGEVASYQFSTQRENWRALVAPAIIEKVYWCATDSSLIAAVSSAGLVLLSSKDGKILRRYTTGTGFRAADFEVTQGKSIAVAATDGIIYVYDFSTAEDKPTMILSGHIGEVNQVVFNPLVPHFLLSASQDKSLRLWDLSSRHSHTASVSSRPLNGHAGPVTAVAWCTLVPFIAISGSLDGFIKVWDTRSCTALASLNVHTFGVCSIDTHPRRPLVFSTSSQNGLIVFWHLNLLLPFFLYASLGTLDQHLVADASTLMAPNPGMTINSVAGTAVQQLITELKETTKPVERMEKISSFFGFPYGMCDLFHAALFLVDQGSFKVSTDSRGTIMPFARLVETQTQQAKHALEKANSKSVNAAGPEYKRKRLLEAAEGILRVGQLREYCDLMVEAQEFDRALAVAPAISRDYWRSLCVKVGEIMEEKGNPMAISYYIMGEESLRAAKLCSTEGSLGSLDSGIVLGMTCPQRVANTAAAAPAEANQNVVVDSNGSFEVVKALISTRNPTIERESNPMFTSCLKILDGANDEAIVALARVGDALMSHLLVHTLPVREQQTIDIAYRMSMMQSCAHKHWDNAILCATRQSNPQDALALVLALRQNATPPSGHLSPFPNGVNTNGATDEMRTFQEQIIRECNKLQLPFDAAVIQQKHANDGLASQNQLAAMALSPSAPVGVTTSPEILQSIAGFMENLIQAALQDPDSANAAFYLKQAYSVSGYVALPWRDYTKNHTSTPMLSQSQIAITPSSTFTAEHKRFLALSFLVAALMCVKVYRFPKLLNLAFSKALEQAEGHANTQALLAKAKAVLGSYSPISVEVRTDGARKLLPMYGADGKRLISSLTNETTIGNVVFLEDETSFLSKNEAIAWMFCCHFSPIANGVRFIPF